MLLLQGHHHYEDTHYDDGHRYHDAPRYEEEYMKVGRRSMGWNNKGQAKGKMAKGQTWTNGGNTTWKGSNNRSVANGQYNGQHNAQHSHHNNHRRSTEWNDWEEKWDDWEEKGEWSESWRSQWRGAEPKQPQQWNQDQKNCALQHSYSGQERRLKHVFQTSGAAQFQSRPPPAAEGESKARKTWENRNSLYNMH